MKCRTIGLIVTLVLGILVALLAAEAQQPGKVPRIGVLVPSEEASPTEPHIAGFRQGLRDLGYVEGQTITVEYLYAHGKVELYAELIAQLVRLKVDVMVVGSGAPTLAAKRATQAIPIVMVGVPDPVRQGFVASLARPGGNITGLALATGLELWGKRVELLKEAVPSISRVGLLYDARSPFVALVLKEVQTATQALGLQFQALEVRELDELDSVLAAMSKEPGGALIVPAAPLFFPHRSHISELIANHRLPAIYTMRVFADAGGLISYGPSLPDTWRRAATYVDKILKGAKPGDLAVEQPMKFELVLNRKTAQALGITFPTTLLVLADEVIQ